MRKSKATAVDLLAKSHRSRELVKQRAVWKTFGVDYEAEKAKQQEIWNQLQRKREKGKSHLQQRYLRKFLRALEKVDTQKKTELVIKDLEELAELAHRHGEDEKLGLLEMLKWARVETHIYRVIFDYNLEDIIKLKKTIADELGGKA